MFFWLVHFVHLQYRFNRISYTPNTVYTHPRSMFHFNVHRTISFHIRFTIFHQLFIQKWARAEKKVLPKFVCQIFAVLFLFLFEIRFFCISTFTTLRCSYRTNTQSEFLLLVAANAVLFSFSALQCSCFYTAACVCIGVAIFERRLSANVFLHQTNACMQSRNVLFGRVL